MDQEQEFPAVVDLNVGGRHFTTHLSTLTKEPDSMLAAMFSGRHPSSKDKDGRFFIDADGEIFCHILNYLRFNRLPSGDIALLVYEQACYFGLQSLISDLESYSSVLIEKCLEKTRAAYPWYRDIIKRIVEQYNRHLSQVTAPVDIHFRKESSGEQMCRYCRERVWTVAAGDDFGEALEHLIRQELQKRDFDMSKVTSTIQRCKNNVPVEPVVWPDPDLDFSDTETPYGQCGIQILHIQIGF